MDVATFSKNRWQAGLNSCLQDSSSFSREGKYQKNRKRRERFAASSHSLAHFPSGYFYLVRIVERLHHRTSFFIYTNCPSISFIRDYVGDKIKRKLTLI